MNIEILTKKQVKEYIKEEMEKQAKVLFKEIDKLAEKTNLLREEFICSMK